MDKIKEFISQNPAIKTFGVLGILVIIVVFVFQTIFSVEIENVWNGLVHPNQKESQKEPNMNSDDAFYNESSVAFGNNDKTQESNISSEYEETSVEETTAEETSIRETATVFDGNQLRGLLIGEDSREEIYAPQQTGIYRFDFDIDSVKKDYIFYILDSSEKEITRSYYSDSDPAGTTVILEEGQEYTLVIENCENDEYDEVQYEITINVPDEIINVADDVLEGKIRYMDQEIEYLYTAPISGIYRFEFDINDVNYNYGFSLYDEKERELASNEYFNKGSTLELSQGKQYKILVTQDKGMPEYNISIGVPNEIRNVTGSKIKGRLKYMDQENVYYYTPSNSGTYKFTFKINDVNNIYDFVLLSKKKEELINTTSEIDERKVELKTGERYEIQIKQNTGYPSYNVKISLCEE